MAERTVNSSVSLRQDAAGPFLSVLTSETRGAIAVVRVWGEGALTAADEAFRPHCGARLVDTPAGRPRIGRVGLGTGDEVVAVVLEEYGGATEVEIQCHGGPAAVDLVVGDLKAMGASRRSVEAWVRHRAASPLGGQAEFDLAQVDADRAAHILLDQSAGAFGDSLTRAINLAVVDVTGAVEEITALIRRASVGTRLLGGWRVALAGRPNVGKSRLLNALAGFGRAIVATTPGTTRDVVTVRTSVDGWPVELADTAGLRATDDPIESDGVSLARASHVEADLVLIVLDRSQPLTIADWTLIDNWPDALFVCNKSDLPAAWEPDERWGRRQIVSAERGDGLPVLLEEIARRLVPEPPPSGSGMPFRIEHVRLLSRCLRLLLGDRPGPAVRALVRLRERGA